MSTNHASAIADHMTLTDHRIKWDHFDVLATGRSDEHCDLQPAHNENIQWQWETSSLLAIYMFFQQIF